MYKITTLCKIFFLVFLASICKAQDSESFDEYNLNTLMMKSVFRIEGANEFNKKVTGTTFILKRTNRNDTTKAQCILLTANHVLSDIKKDYAKLIIRNETDENSFEREEYLLKIRHNGDSLWIVHPDTSLDIAAMEVEIPNMKNLIQLKTSFLASDSIFEHLPLRPGDELNCIGFPFGFEANDAGFPILRSGNIASYPITPINVNKYFLFDFESFEGNSGGPVYTNQTQRMFFEPNRIFVTDFPKQYVIGIITEDWIDQLEITTDYLYLKQKIPMKIAKVIPSPFILELIDLIPYK